MRPLPGHDAAPNALRRGVHWRSAQTMRVASALSSCRDGSRSHAGTVSGGRIRRIRSRIARNSHCGTATWAILFMRSNDAPLCMNCGFHPGNPG